MTQHTKTAAIIGAGVAGLSSAICLSLRGWTVTVFEQAHALAEVGAGLQISPNGTRVLQAMGVMEHLGKQTFVPQSIRMQMGHSGRRICDIPLGDSATRRWGAPYVHVHRQDLVDGLAARLMEISTNTMRFGQAVAAHDLTGFDLIVGADGVHSKTRDLIVPNARAIFTGNVAWRALVPVCDMPHGLLPPKSATIWAGDGRHAVTTYVRGGDVINFVGIVEQDDWASDSWTSTGDLAQAQADFTGWHPTIQAILANAQITHQWALLDHAPLPRWSDGHRVILGDAAHPMLPSLAQGAVQSIEDAWVLAAMVDEGAQDIPTALSAFYHQRIARTSKVQNGAASHLRLFHKSGILAQWATYAPIALVGRLAPWLLQRRQDWLFSYDAVREFPLQS